MNSTTTTRTCASCNGTFPATDEYFYPRKDSKDGLKQSCKVCILEYQRAYRHANRVKIAEKKHSYHQVNLEKRREYQRKYNQKNQDKRLEKQREYNQENRDKILERQREYYHVNKDKIAEKYRVKSSLRRARKRQLPDTFTVEQWLTCLEYHHFCCAVCGCQLRDLFGNVVPHADHWIPLSHSDCLGTTPDNMICLCSSCNLSKGDKLPAVWLIEKYSTRKANEILARIAAYLNWIINPIVT